MPSNSSAILRSSAAIASSDIARAAARQRAANGVERLVGPCWHLLTIRSFCTVTNTAARFNPVLPTVAFDPLRTLGDGCAFTRTA